MWRPGHIGIESNELADIKAKIVVYNNPNHIISNIIL